MLRGSISRVYWKRLLRRSSEEAAFVEVESGKQQGLKIRKDFRNRNPRNLEKMNIAHRDLGWGAGPANNQERFMTAETIKNTDPHGLRIEVTNLPAHATHHTVELIRRGDFVEGVCRHYRSGIIASASSEEAAISSQIVEKTDRIASYVVGRTLAARMLMAGITNASYPFIPHSQEDSITAEEDDFTIALEEMGIIFEEPFDENSRFRQIKFTERDDGELPSWTRGQTPSQIKNNNKFIDHIIKK